MGKVIAFPVKKVSSNEELRKLTMSDCFKPDEVEAFNAYIKSAELWMNTQAWETLYEGYPQKPPCEAPHENMHWFVNSMKSFGVWVINQSENPIKQTNHAYGWNPFVRKSTAPLYGPLNVPNVKARKMITWVVDEQGYGQYGMVNEQGYVWVPTKRPKDWVDPN